MAEAQSVVKDDRGGTSVPEDTARLKGPGPCPECGGRWWRGPIAIRAGIIQESGEMRDFGPILYYEAECRNPKCEHRVRM